ncbi:MAG: TonB-dependent receptor [Saprospiraceae bacterium]|nr:TonB-dependent receptor [Saprospiraceae bacterium]
MKNWFCLFALLFCTHTVWSQIPGNSTRTKGIGKIVGFIVDEEKGDIIEFATISLYRGEELIDGTITDEKGKFALSGLIDGTYKLEVSFLGYDKKTIEGVEIKKERTLNLKRIGLVTGAATLEEVTVTGERQLIEEKVDRMVYNADQDNLSKGGDAADVLRKVPLLSVDLEGNVSLRGSSNIQVLINNKPSTIVAADVSDALKMLPADIIKTVEVITSPSAKYDAEGSGGIINIITKKNNLEGYYLNINSGIGLRGSNLGLNGSLRTGKFGMTLGGFGRAFYNDAETTMDQLTITDTGTRLTRQSSEADDNGIFGRYNIGFDYDIDKTQFLSGGVRFGIRDFRRDELQTTDIFADDQLLQYNLRNIDSKRYSGSTDFNVDYLKIFSPGHEFSISTLYSRTDQNSNFISDNLDENENFLNSIKNLDDNLNQEVTVQTDYIYPIGDKQIFEVGAKGIFRSVNSDYSYQFASVEGVFEQDFRRPAGNLDYDQNVAAGYTSYTLSLPGKYTVKGGVRYEQTSIEAVQDGENIDIPNYSNLVPSVNLSKTFKDFTTIKLGYNRRIQRPWLRQLNPNVNVQNSQDIQVGNPNLRPELADNLELGFSKLIKKTYLNISLFGRSTDNAINQVRFPIDSVPGAIITTYENIGRERSLGMNLFANINFTDKWTMNGGLDLRHAWLEGQVTGADGTSETAKNSGWNYGGRLMSQYKLGNGWTAQGFAFMRGRRVQLQGSRGGFGAYSLGLNKDFKNKKGSIGLAAENFLNRGWNVNTELNSAFFNQSSNMLLLNRSIRINFNYRIGKMDIRRSRKKTRSVRNDDLMGGGDSGGMGGMQSGAGGAPSGASSGSRSAGSRTSQSSSKSKGSAKPATPAEKAIDFSGNWKGVSQTPRGEMVQTFTFKIEDKKLSGSVKTPFGGTDLSNTKLEGNKFSFEVSFGQFTIAQNGVVVDENTIVLSSDRGELTLTKEK